MITGAQIKAAHVFLGGSFATWLRRAAIEIADVQDVEDAPKPPTRHIESIREALQDAGTQFIDSVGVELLPIETGLQAAAKAKR